MRDAHIKTVTSGANKKGLARKADAGHAKRVLILDQEKCKPNMPAYQFLAKIARSCGGMGMCVGMACDRVSGQVARGKT